MSSISGSGRFPGGEHGNPLQFSCPENSRTEESGRLPTIDRVAESQTWLKLLSMYTQAILLSFSYLESGHQTKFFIKF